MKFTLPKHLACLLALAAITSVAGAHIAPPEEARAIAKEAYIYGNPVVDKVK